MTNKKLLAFGSSALLLFGCGEEVTRQAPSTDPLENQTASPKEDGSERTKIESVLLEQLSCQRPAQAALVMSGLLRQQLIAETDDGADGIRLFVPVKPMTFLDFPIVRMGGWQSDESGEVMEPFLRGPGTPPPAFITLTVIGTVEDVRAKFAALGVAESDLVPDKTRAVEVLQDGTMTAPHRLTPGVGIAGGDDELTSNLVEGAVTISCSATKSDFDKDVQARLEN